MIIATPDFWQSHTISRPLLLWGQVSLPKSGVATMLVIHKSHFVTVSALRVESLGYLVTELSTAKCCP